MDCAVVARVAQRTAGGVRCKCSATAIQHALFARRIVNVSGACACTSNLNNCTH